MLRFFRMAALCLLGALLIGVRAMAQAPAAAPERAGVQQWWDAQPRVNLPFDNNGAKVLIVEFTDLQCPHCRAKYVELQPVLAKYAAHPSDVKFLIKHWPISATCNPHVTSNPHPAACDAAAAAVMTRARGTFDAFVDWCFVHQDDMTAETVRRAAAEIGKVTDFDAQYPRALQEVKTDIALGAALGVGSTPTFFVNGRRLPGGGLGARDLDAVLELELARAK